MINWFKGLFGFPTKSEVIRDTILTLAKDRTLLESALSLSDEMDRHKAKKAAKPERKKFQGLYDPVLDATDRIKQLRSLKKTYVQIADCLNVEKWMYMSKYTRGQTQFNSYAVKHILCGEIKFNKSIGAYVSSDWARKRSLKRHLTAETSRGLKK